MDWTNILIGGAVAGIVLFVWYGMAWMALPHHKADYRACPERAAIEQALAKVPHVDAWYAVPFHSEYPRGLQDPGLAARMNQGPNAILTVLRPGPGMTGGIFACGFLLNVFEGIALALLAAISGDHAATLGGRLLVFVGAALFVGFSSYLMQHVYARYPRRFAFTNTFDKVVGFALVAVLFTWLGPVA